jgi:hypothetical protein
MDAAISPTEGADSENGNVELPVEVDSLAVDGVAPEVGDKVDIKVGGTVTRVVNNIAYVKPEDINGTAMPKPPLETSSDVDELDRLYNMSQSGKATGEY